MAERAPTGREPTRRELVRRFDSRFRAARAGLARLLEELPTYGEALQLDVATLGDVTRRLATLRTELDIIEQTVRDNQQPSAAVRRRTRRSTPRVAKTDLDRTRHDPHATGARVRATAARTGPVTTTGPPPARRPAYQVWVEFNDVDEGGVTTSLVDAARPGTDLSVGSTVVVGDEEGNTAQAEVLGHDTDRGVLWLRVATDTFRAPGGDLGPPTLPDDR